MSEVELERRRVHGVLSSKSLLESLEALTINKSMVQQKTTSTSGKSSLKSLDAMIDHPLVFRLNARNHSYLSLPDSLVMSTSGMIIFSDFFIFYFFEFELIFGKFFEDQKSDENFIPMKIRFSAERLGTSHAVIELNSFPNDVRLVELDFKVTENGAIDSTTIARLQFSSCVFDSIMQPIPIVIEIFFRISIFCFVLIFFPFVSRKTHRI